MQMCLLSLYGMFMVFEGNEYSLRPIFLTTRENVPRIPVTQEGVLVLCCLTDPLVSQFGH